MADYIAYVAKDIFNQRGQFQHHLTGLNCFTANVLEMLLSLLPAQLVTSSSVPGVEPARSSAASVGHLRLVFTDSSATHQHSFLPPPGPVFEHNTLRCLLDVINVKPLIRGLALYWPRLGFTFHSALPDNMIY